MPRTPPPQHHVLFSFFIEILKTACSIFIDLQYYQTLPQTPLLPLPPLNEKGPVGGVNTNLSTDGFAWSSLFLGASSVNQQRAGRLQTSYSGKLVRVDLSDFSSSGVEVSLRAHIPLTLCPDMRARSRLQPCSLPPHGQSTQCEKLDPSGTGDGDPVVFLSACEKVRKSTSSSAPASLPHRSAADNDHVAHTKHNK